MCDGVCFKLDKQTWSRKNQWYTEGNLSKSTRLIFCDIWQNFYFYRTLNNKNFKMEVEKTNFVTHLIITLSKNLSVKIWSNTNTVCFEMVMIDYSKLCASLQENLTSE